MAGLAIIGLETLRQSNARTEKLIRDQDRIATFNELYGYCGDLQILVGAVGLNPVGMPHNSPNIFRFSGVVLVDRVGDLLLVTAQARRRIGRDGMPDADAIARFHADIKLLSPLAVRADGFRKASDYEAASFVALSEIQPIVARLQRTAYSQVQIIEAEMAETAKSTTLAYEASRELVIASALIAVGLALLLGYAISSSIIWPVQRIGQALGAIAEGGFDAKVAVPNKDELGDLARNVNVTSEQLGELYREVEDQRAKLATEHARSEALLYNLLPKEIAARLKNTPDRTIADSLPQVAILFADIVDFTPRAARLQPDEVIDFLNRIFSAFDVLAATHGLEKIKTIGDAYMVAAGIPGPVEDPVHRVARMALDILRIVANMAQEFPDGLQIRVGLHAGPVVAGVIGNQKLFYDVWGETVNTASRMESHGEPGRIQVTKEVKEELEDAYDFEPRGGVYVKGVGEVETWWLTGACAAK
ncbi:MAG: adenylate/guanylate cyclase domain-containing protein [Arenibacterium sp.]